MPCIPGNDIYIQVIKILFDLVSASDKMCVQWWKTIDNHVLLFSWKDVYVMYLQCSLYTNN